MKDSTLKVMATEIRRRKEADETAEKTKSEERLKITARFDLLVRCAALIPKPLGIFWSKCPKCGAKLKRERYHHYSDVHYSHWFCTNKKCDYEYAKRKYLKWDTGGDI